MTDHLRARSMRSGPFIQVAASDLRAQIERALRAINEPLVEDDELHEHADFSLACWHEQEVGDR